MRTGSNIYGSSEKLTSKANENIIPDGKSFYKFSLMCESDTTVSINDSEPIFVQGGMGFGSDQIDAKIYSFKFLDDGVVFFWVGGN